MPRRPRLELPGIPMHVTQRGVNRCAIFLDDADRQHFCRLLRAYFRDVAIHAYVLMDNHVHLLTSTRQAGVLAQAMRLHGQSYVAYFNRRHGRSGTLWQGRFKSCLVDTDRHLLAVMRYIELNPVRAAMTARPEDHPWSSVHAHLGRASDPLLEPHPAYRTLGATHGARADAYGKWLRSAMGDDELAAIRRHLAQERALGRPRFQQMVEKALNRAARCRPRGRPGGKGD